MDTDIINCIDKATNNLFSSDIFIILQGYQLLDALIGKLCITKRKSFTKSKWSIPSEKDTVFGQFIQLQDNFQYNLTNIIVTNLSQIRSSIHIQTLKSQIEGNELEVYNQCMSIANRLLQGILLLHPPSRKIFYRESNMKLIISYINEEELTVENQISVIQTIVHILVKNVPNFRQFEKLNGPQSIIKKLNKPNSSQDLNFKIVEFLIFYLVRETNSNGNVISSDGFERKTTEDKAKILSDNIPDINGLLQQLKELKPFGNVEW